MLSRFAVSNKDVTYPAGLTQSEAVDVCQVVRAHLDLSRHLVHKLTSGFEPDQPVGRRTQVRYPEPGGLYPQDGVRQERFDPPGPKASSLGTTEIGTHIRFASDAEPGAHRSSCEIDDVRIESGRCHGDPVNPADDRPVGHH